jgi:mannose-6-phosphate isomerase-like protein (cupin superfamily)
MRKIERRSCLGMALAALPLAARGQSLGKSGAAARAPVRSGEDRLGERHTLGVSSTAYKVSGPDTNGGLFIMEHANRTKGGPVRHVHHHEEEWFYALDGEYIVEVGSERFRLKPGDSILGPREIPHAWAFAGGSSGSLLIAFAPANKMEDYFQTLQARAGAYSKWDDPGDLEIARAHGIELLGPPLSLQ